MESLWLSSVDAVADHRRFLTSLYSLVILVSRGPQNYLAMIIYLADSTPEKLFRMQVSSTPSTPRASFFSREDFNDLRTYGVYALQLTTLQPDCMLTLRTSFQS